MYTYARPTSVLSCGVLSSTLQPRGWRLVVGLGLCVHTVSLACMQDVATIVMNSLGNEQRIVAASPTFGLLPADTIIINSPLGPLGLCEVSPFGSLEGVCLAACKSAFMCMPCAVDWAHAVCTVELLIFSKACLSGKPSSDIRLALVVFARYMHALGNPQAVLHLIVWTPQVLTAPAALSTPQGASIDADRARWAT